MFKHDNFFKNGSYWAFNALTTFNLDILQAGYTPESSPKNKQISNPNSNTVKFKDKFRLGRILDWLKR